MTILAGLLVIFIIAFIGIFACFIVFFITNDNRWVTAALSCLAVSVVCGLLMGIGSGQI